MKCGIVYNKIFEDHETGLGHPEQNKRATFIFKKITFQKIAYPILFLPFLSRCSDIIGKKILFKF
mgnify:CR=1